MSEAMNLSSRWPYFSVMYRIRLSNLIQHTEVMERALFERDNGQRNCSLVDLMRQSNEMRELIRLMYCECLNEVELAAHYFIIPYVNRARHMIFRVDLIMNDMRL